MSEDMVINPSTGNLDKIQSESYLDTLYLKLDCSNDPLTGLLTITPASGNTALKADKDIILKAGQKLIFDGA